MCACPWRQIGVLLPEAEQPNAQMLYSYRGCMYLACCPNCAHVFSHPPLHHFTGTGE